jgi:RNA polymerase sigma-B factor
LADDQLRRLFTNWQQDGSTDAREALVQRFMPLARKLAHRYAGANEPFDDLLQVASVGLLLAIDRFDCRRGVAFTSFAVPTILGELRRYFRDLGWAVHMPRRTQEQALCVDNAVRELTQQNGRAPTVGQLAQVLEWAVEDVLNALEAANAHHAVSLDAPGGDRQDEEGRPLADAFGDEDPGFGRVEERLALAAAARSLNDRERLILRMRFADDMTQSEIGAQIGVSQMQVSRILRELIGGLRERADPELASLTQGGGRPGGPAA